MDQKTIFFSFNGPNGSYNSTDTNDFFHHSNHSTSVHIRMTRYQSRGIVSNAETTASTYQTVSEGVPVSRSTYYELPKDEWDT